MVNEIQLTQEQIDEIDLKTENEDILFGNTASVIRTADDGRLPVSYENAEEALLAMFILDDDVAEYIIKSGLNETHFSKRKNRIIFPLIYNVRLERSACTYDFVVDKLEGETMPDGQTVLSFVGGLSKLSEIIECCPAVIDLNVAQGYVEIIHKQWKLAKVQEITRKIGGQKKYDESALITDLSDLEQVVSDRAVERGGLISLGVLIPDAYERYMDRRNNPQKYKGMETGFYWLNRDRAISKKHVTVIGASTNIGKSVLVSNIITKMILDDVKLLLFTPELDRREYIDRLMCGEAKVSIERWNDGAITDEDNTRYGVIQDKLLKKAQNLYVEDRGNQSCSFILSSIKKHLLNHIVDVVVVDYLQDLDYVGDTRRAITDIMRRFCAFAKDNDIAFIVLSQFRRFDDSREPTKEDLKESGDIENMADCVILLHRLSLTTHGERNKGWYKIAKNRHGPLTDNVALTFWEDYLKFTENDIPESGKEDQGTLIGDYDNSIPDESRPTEQSVAEQIKKEQGSGS